MPLFKRLLKSKRSFRKEFKREIKYALKAGVGFLVAYAWRDAVLEVSKTFVREFTETTKTALTSIYAALLITLLGVIIILFSSRMLRD